MTDQIEDQAVAKSHQAAQANTGRQGGRAQTQGGQKANQKHDRTSSSKGQTHNRAGR